MSRNVVSRVFLGACILIFGATFARADLISDFNASGEGWQVVSFTNLTTSDLTVAATYTPTFHATGGNPQGYISTTDQDNGDLTFSAPGKFLGDVSAATGLSYDLIYPVGDINYQPTDLILMGNGETLLWKSSPDIVPGSSWTTVNVSFAPSGGWHVGTSGGALATAADFANVLGNLSGLFIRGEFTTGLIESPGLDNVRLAGVTSAVPEPGTFGMLALAGVSLVFFRRKKA